MLLWGISRKRPVGVSVSGELRWVAGSRGGYESRGWGAAGLRTVVVAARRAVEGGELLWRNVSLILVAYFGDLPEEAQLVVAMLPTSHLAFSAILGERDIRTMCCATALSRASSVSVGVLSGLNRYP